MSLSSSPSHDYYLYCHNPIGDQGVHNARLGQPASKFGKRRRMGFEKWPGLGTGESHILIREGGDFDQ